MQLLLLVSALGVPEPPPYTFNLDQSVPCPKDLNDAWYSGPRSSLLPVTANESAELEELIASVPAMLDADSKRLGAPSSMIIAMSNNKLLFESYRGTARLSKSVPVTADSGFMIASNSKVFTSVMMYQLRDRGLLPQGLDTPVAVLMPDWEEPAPPGRSRRGLTLRALATHASGLPRETPPGGDEKDILKGIGAADLLFPQYASTAYSNLGLALLGRTLEKATGGRTWEEWVAQEIMAPLGMSRSGPCLRTAAEAAAIVDGVDESGALVHRHFTNSSRCSYLLAPALFPFPLRPGAPLRTTINRPHRASALRP